MTAACGPFPSTVCGKEQRTELLNVVLEPWTPSPPFILGTGKIVWIQLTRRPFVSDPLFGSTGAIAEVHPIADGTRPKVTTDPNGEPMAQDPSILIHKELTWQKLSMGSGSWQLYSESNPGIEVVSCPGG